MTVSELIEQLKNFDGDAPVVVAKVDYVGLKYGNVTTSNSVRLDEFKREADDDEDGEEAVVIW